MRSTFDTLIGRSATEEDPDPDPASRVARRSFLRTGTGLVRIAVGAWWRTSVWAAETSARASSRIVRAAATGTSTPAFLQEIGAEAQDRFRRLLGIEGRRPAPQRGDATVAASSNGSLRERGAELLRLSADIDYEESAHPAYDRILDDLAPDEGRILRMLCREGPQPAVDVRTSRPFNIGSQLVAAGLSMIGEEAGCRYMEQLPAYLNNLYRLGLVWFSREPLEDPLRYQVLEAQPDVTNAKNEAGRGRTIRRSIVLTPLGEDFCRACLPEEEAQLEDSPETAPPGA